MRKVLVSATAIRGAYLGGGRKPSGELVVTGYDADTGDLVTFYGDAPVLAEFCLRAEDRDDPAAELDALVGEDDVIQVVPAPVSGEWDSPGTSPEDS